MRRIKTTFEIVTDESAREGEVAERGWKDEEGSEITPDDYDIDEYGDESSAAIALAVKWLCSAGAVESSSNRFHRGVWYSGSADRDGETESFHLDGFSADEESAIFAALGI